MTISNDRAIKIGWYSEMQLLGELLLERDTCSQKEMAKKYGVSEQYMSDILNNKRNIPKKVADKMGFMPMKVFFKYSNEKAHSREGEE